MIRVEIASQPHLRFYKTSAFTGSRTSRFTYGPERSLLKRDKSRTIYAYFKWIGQFGTPVQTMSPPQISLAAWQINYERASEHLVPNA